MDPNQIKRTQDSKKRSREEIQCCKGGDTHEMIAPPVKKLNQTDDNKSLIKFRPSNRDSLSKESSPTLTVELHSSSVQRPVLNATRVNKTSDNKTSSSNLQDNVTLMEKLEDESSKKYDCTKNNNYSENVACNSSRKDESVGSGIKSQEFETAKLSGETCQNKSHGINKFSKLKDNSINETHSGSEEETNEENVFIPVGLVNLQNNCYINSVVQAVLQVGPIRKYFQGFAIDSVKREGLSEDAKLAFDFITDVQITTKYCNSKQAILKNVMTNIYQRDEDSIISGRDQQDAHEFLNLLISAIDSFLDETNQAKSIISLLTGEMKVSLTCERCQAQRTILEKWTNLSVPLQVKRSFKSCLVQSFVSIEKLTGNDRVYCENCKEKTETSRRSTVEKLPEVLFIQILLFSSGTDYGTEKLSFRYSIPSEFDFDMGFREKKKNDSDHNQTNYYGYELCSIVAHSGNTLQSGHYISFVWDECGAAYCCDDENIAKLSDEQEDLVLNGSEKATLFKSFGRIWKIPTLLENRNITSHMKESCGKKQ